MFSYRCCLSLKRSRLDRFVLVGQVFALLLNVDLEGKDIKMRQIQMAPILIISAILFSAGLVEAKTWQDRYGWSNSSSQASDGVESSNGRRSPFVVQTQSTVTPQPQLVQQGQFGTAEQVGFYDAFKKRSQNTFTRRGGRFGRFTVHQMPSRKVSGQTQIACGSRHIRSHRSQGYMHETSACMLSAVAQEWRKTMCPNNTPDCQLMIGDMTYGQRKPGHWPHKSHRKGYCVDVWPIRKPGYSGELSRYSKGYDQARTKKLIQIMHKYGSDTPRRGGRQIFFNDPSIRRAGLVRRFRNHDDHIHACFRPTKESRRKCNAMNFDTRYCPELGPKYQQQQLFVEQLGNSNVERVVN